MDPQKIRELLVALRLELVTYKEWCIVIFVGVASVVLALGLIWPQTYRTSAVLYADVTNIIEPLLRGRAEVTKVDRSQTAKDVIYTRRFAENVAIDVGMAKDANDNAGIDRVVSLIRSAVKIESVSKDYFRISFAASDPDRSFNILNTVVNSFIEYTSKQKKDESYSAYKFIDSQVQAYKKQLEEAELRLKDFKAANVEGTEASVSSRISSLRSEIESLRLSIEENQSRVSTFKSQLSNESDYLQARSRLDALQARKKALTDNLEGLRLVYQDNYPDIVTLKAQIAEVDNQMQAIYESEGLNAGGSRGSENPLYEELRKQLSVAEVELKAQNQRMMSLERLLEQEYGRAQKVAENEASLAELTRDYNVTREVYEEMLGRKESARLSMVLDIEGQGVTYRIHEPAIFPLKPSGLLPIHFAVVAPFLALLTPIGLAIAYIMLDPRVRSYSRLVEAFNEDLPVIASVPHTSTAITKRIVKRDAMIIMAVLVLFFAVYSAVVFQKILN